MWYRPGIRERIGMCFDYLVLTLEPRIRWAVSPALRVLIYVSDVASVITVFTTDKTTNNSTYNSMFWVEFVQHSVMMGDPRRACDSELRPERASKGLRDSI